MPTVSSILLANLKAHKYNNNKKMFNLTKFLFINALSKDWLSF